MRAASTASSYADSELLESLRGLGVRWRQQLMAAGVLLRSRPDPTTWSAIEYAAHSRDVTALHAFGVEQALTATSRRTHRSATTSSTKPPALTPTPIPTWSVDELAKSALRLAQLADDAGVGAWTRGLTVGETRSDIRRLLEHALHDSQHHLDDVGRGVASMSH